MKVFLNLVLFIQLMLCITLHAQQSDLIVQSISWHDVENGYYGNTNNPLIYSDSAIVYSKPDTSSAVINALQFKEPIKILREGFDESLRPIRKWYEVNQGMSKGYIKAVDVATHVFYNMEHHTYYFVVTDFIPSLTETYGFAIYKYDDSKKQFTGTFKSDRIRGDIVVEVNRAGWKNVDLIIHGRQIDAYCGGGIFETFVVDANGNMTELISTSQSGDDGSADSYASTVWLPIKFPNKNVLLVQDGDVEHIFNEISGTLNTRSFPKQLTFPKMELIVFNEVKVESIVDKNGEMVLNKDGSYKSKVAMNKTTYYRWNGVKLVMVKM